MPTSRIVKQHYSHDVHTVGARLSDPAFLRRGAEANGETEVAIDVEGSDEERRLCIARDVRVELPGILKHLLKPVNRVVEQTRWRSADQGWFSTFTIGVGGVPARIHGTMKVTPDASGSSFEAEFEVRAKLPWFAGTAEQIVADRVELSVRGLAVRCAEELSREGHVSTP